VKEYRALDGHRFAKPEAAERAAREHSTLRRVRPLSAAVPPT
jgi:hypothetical protein